MVYRGQAGNGELGYGPNGKKSSANPDKVYALEGVHTHQVACGIGHTLFLVKPGTKQVTLFHQSDCSSIVCNLHLIPYNLGLEPDVAHQTSWLKSTGEYDIAVLSKSVQECTPEVAHSQ